MRIKESKFLKSSSKFSECPKPDMPEYAFIGRSNVGKSSLINMLTGRKKLAKTSSAPGKTQLINHFMINESWYLVDLPGYGYAKVSKKDREQWMKATEEYLSQRENLLNVFLLVDARHSLQQIDREFMHWLGENGLPFSIVFTKCDKIVKSKITRQIEAYKTALKEDWEEFPPTFLTSSESKLGKKEIHDYIAEVNKVFSKK